MLFDLTKLADPSYLFDPRPPYEFALLKPLLVAYGGILVTALLVSLFPWQPWQRRLKDRLSLPLWIAGVGGLVLLFFRSQSIAYFGSRIVHLLFWLALVGWIGYSLIVARREVQASRLEYVQRQRLERYLPKRKKR